MFTTLNPYNQEKLADYPAFDATQTEETLQKAATAYLDWRNTSLPDRSGLLIQAAQILRHYSERYARTLTLEMGKPIRQSRSEIEKCAWVCEYYATQAANFLSDEKIETDAGQSWISYHPIGAVLAIMPWNFPFWQVFRFAAPTLMAGNVALLKHAPNVLGSTLLIEKVFREAGFPEGVFQNLIIETHDVESIIRHPVVKAVTLTGSDRAGSAVAALAGSEIKKSVLELGGSNAFIVLDDADLPLAVDAGVAARMQNNGQSCIAAKRFLIQRGISGTYIRHFTDQMKGFVTGDPLDEKTTLGPLARIDLAEKLEQQVQKSVEMGATCLLGGKRNRTFFEPTVLTGVVPGMPAFDEELFGPVAAFTEIDNLDHAIELSNLSVYGLGVSIFTHQTEAVIARLHQLEDGAVFVNEMVKSDPRLPFGGTKRSGFGRELSAIGIREFTNIKTVYIR